uniref:Copper transport protein n=1 Tax=Pseudictyota dubia TaxID=2749911 RepID=A0A6U2D2M1_9STRA
MVLLLATAIALHRNRVEVSPSSTRKAPSFIYTFIMHHSFPSSHGHDHDHDMPELGDSSYPIEGNLPPLSPMAAASSGAGVSAAAAPFCTGSSAMYMSGFRFALASGDGSHPCLNLFFEAWTLNSPAKFVFGALFVFVLAAMTEGLSALRRGVRRWMGPGPKRKALSVATHALQATMGYALMLAAMTYAGEMFLAVVCGMATGYALFFDDVGRVKGMAMAGLVGGGNRTAADHCLVDAGADEDAEGGPMMEERILEDQMMPDNFTQEVSSGMGSGRTYRISNRKGA